MTTFTPGPTPNTARAADGKIFLPPGDAAMTRRVKDAGDHWVVHEKKVRKIFSRGVWAAMATIERIRDDLESKRATEGFAKKREADARRRDKAQAEYVEDFHGAVVVFLGFMDISLISPSEPRLGMGNVSCHWRERVCVPPSKHRGWR